MGHDAAVSTIDTAGPARAAARVELLGRTRRPRLSRGPLPVAAGTALLLLAGLAATRDLGTPGVLAGLAYTGGLLWLLTRAVRHTGLTSLGPADLVTLGRALLVGGVSALIVDGLVGGSTATPALVGLATLALLLDGVDGQVARRTGTASSLGARFDMEVDAFLVLVLSVHVVGLVGIWALAIGAMRYVFVAAGWAAPWLRGSLPPSYAAKTVAALQGIVLVVASSLLLSRPLAVGLVAVALGALSWSFGRDVRRLWRSSTAQRAQQGAATG